MKATHCLLSILLVFSMLPNQVHCEADSAEQLVKNFYHLYTRCDKNLSIHNDLTQYVDACALNAVRILNNRSHFSREYFTKSQDCWDEGDDAFIVHKEMKINDTTSVVPISLRWPIEMKHHLLVFVQKEKAGWRIIKVTGTDDFYE